MNETETHVSVLMEAWESGVWHIFEFVANQFLPSTPYGDGGWFASWRTYCGLTPQNQPKVGPVGPDWVELTLERSDTGLPVSEDVDNCKNCLRVFRQRYLIEVGP